MFLCSVRGLGNRTETNNAKFVCVYQENSTRRARHSSRISGHLVCSVSTVSRLYATVKRCKQQQNKNISHLVHDDRNESSRKSRWTHASRKFKVQESQSEKPQKYFRVRKVTIFSDNPVKSVEIVSILQFCETNHYFCRNFINEKDPQR